MNEAARSIELQLASMKCNPCGFMWWVPAWWQQNKHNDGGDFHCPSCGMTLVYCELEVTKLRRQIDVMQKNRDFWQGRTQEEVAASQRLIRRLNATRGVLTKVRKRVTAGLCPVIDCHRHFRNLAAHMKTKHPRYQPAAEVG